MRVSKILAMTAFALFVSVNAQPVWAGGSGTDTVQVNGADGAGDDFRVTPGPAGGRSSAWRDGNDVLIGNQGNDFVFGETGNDPRRPDVNGQGGSDIIIGSTGLANMNPSARGHGGAGNDTVQVNGANQPATDPYDLGVSDRGPMPAHHGSDLLIYNNGDGSDFLEGGPGGSNPSIGGSGNDVLLGDRGIDAVRRAIPNVRKPAEIRQPTVRLPNKAMPGDTRTITTKRGIKITVEVF